MRKALRGGRALEAEYPLVFRPGMPGRVVTLEHEGGVVSTCATLVRNLKCYRREIRIGLIGSVATDQSARGRGHCSELLTHAENLLAEEGALVALLWAEDPEFYRNRGYQAIGGEQVLAFGPNDSERVPVQGVRPMQVVDRPLIHSLYEQQSRATQRRSAETEALLECPGMRVVVHGAPGAVDAYACLGRGEDFAGVVHEWSGAPDSVRMIINHLRGELEPDGSLFVTGPVDDSTMAEIAHDAAATRRGMLAMGRLINGPGLAKWLHDEELAPVSVVGGRFRLSGTRGQSFLGDEELLSVAFSECADRELHTELEERLGVDLEQLPLPIYLWGLDSI